ncbi:hypothetical protein ACFWIB_39275 [Streptomyces sp. NPDC127051]|uniref:hypothetical protein n=1 Tax=Streptomyces sp. NPDC127051 TaxID=3347119 RepID=UPI0036569491
MPDDEGSTRAPEPDAVDLSAVGLDAPATQVVHAVLAGEMEPLEGAGRLAGQWGPVEPVDLGDGARPRTHFDPPGFPELYVIVFDLLDGGDSERASRLAEFQWYIAQRIGTDELITVCAVHWGQTLRDDPASGRRRLELLEYAVPELLTWDHPREDKAMLLYHLAMARRAEAAGDPEALRATVDACEQALAMADLGDEISANLHFVAGRCGTAVGETAADLDSPVRHLREAVRITSGAGHTEDEQLAQEALAAALRTRAELADGAARRSRGALEARIGTPLQEGDQALRTSLSQEERSEAYRLRATQKYLTAAGRTGGIAPPSIRAEIQHRMAALQLEETEDDELWTGVCFAAAARRLGRDDWQPSNLARADTHLARMLIKLGMMDAPQLLRAACGLLRDAMPAFEVDGLLRESVRLARDYRSCLTLLAAHGDEEAAASALVLEGAHQLQRVRDELADAPTGGGTSSHQAYLRIVLEEAESSLGAFLARSEIARRALILGFDPRQQVALALLEEARGRREVGDFTGAADLASDALDLAEGAYADATLPWCDAAELSAGMGLREDAEGLLNVARQLMDVARDPEETVEGYVPGNWFAVRGLAAYRDRIEKASARVRELAAGVPRFDPSVTAALLRPDDESGRPALAESLRRRLGQSTDEGER